MLFIYRQMIMSNKVEETKWSGRKTNTIPKVTNIRLSLERFKGNPILRPDDKHRWETKAVFNPAAIYEGGKVHILYRAIGESDVSVLGYASSLDGLHINERLDKPVYVPREPFEGVNPSHPYVLRRQVFMSQAEVVWVAVKTRG